MSFPREYDRDRNVNTPAYWRSAYRQSENRQDRTKVIHDRIMEGLSGLPAAPVQEYGFLHTHLAERIGADRWQGFDIAVNAVQSARSKGFDAMMRRCGKARKPNGAYVVAVEVLEHLDLDEMNAFLSVVSTAKHAFFSVPHPMKRDLRFPAHMRTFGWKDDFRDFLLRFWPVVEAEKVLPYWLLAHCSRED